MEGRHPATLDAQPWRVRAPLYLVPLCGIEEVGHTVHF